MPQFKNILIFLGLVILFLPAVVFFPNYGTGDMDIWLEWTSHVDMWGPLNAYSKINARADFWTVHPPIYFINLYLALKAASLFSVSSMIGIKTILLFYYLATWASLIYLSFISKRKSIWAKVLVSSGLFLGGMYFVVNSEAFSYLDITFAPFVVLTLALFTRRRYLLSGICLALAVLVKWVVVVLLPIFLLYFIYKKGRRYKIDKPLFKFLAGMTLVLGLLILVFWLNHVPLYSIVESLKKAFGHGSQFLAPGALNFSWIIGYVVLELMYPETYGMIIKNNLPIIQSASTVIFTSVSLVILKGVLERKKNIVSLLQASLMISWGYFIWRTGVHENHIFTSVLIALCLVIINTSRSNLLLYFWLSFFGLVNMLVLYGFPVRGGFVAIPMNFLVLGLLAILHVLIYLFYLRRYLQ